MKKLIEKLIAPFTMVTLLVIMLQIYNDHDPNKFKAFGFALVIITAVIIYLYLYLEKKSDNK
nr:hypothetical protein [Helcococcus sueciensis]